jgi:hypothetical protein
MKRDMDLIRLLLLQCEGEEPKPDLSSYTEEQQVYHAALLVEAALIHGAVLKDGEGHLVGAAMVRLTWAGHEFLDAARNETIWRKAGERIKKAGVQVTVAVLEELLKKLLKEPLGLP